jgi:formate dehydrogenase subunit gamma
MVNRYDPSIATQIIAGCDARPEMLVQILHEFVTRFAFISDQAIVQIADELNLSRADVHGVVSFYHDFRTSPPGKHVLKICQAESCQAMGSRSLSAHAQEILGIAMNETSSDGETTLEPVYCLGNCACSPAVMLDGNVYGRVDANKLDALLEDKGARG